MNSCKICNGVTDNTVRMFTEYVPICWKCEEEIVKRWIIKTKPTPSDNMLTLKQLASILKVPEYRQVIKELGQKALKEKK